MQVRLRRGTDADARQVADLWLRARSAALGAIPPAAHPPHEVRDFFASHVLPTMEVWLAEDEDGALAGILVLHGPWLEQLYVDPELTGRGIGTTLLALAKERSPGGLRLWTFVSNTGAQRFYERHGFHEAERTDGRDNEERAPDILYVWPGAGVAR